MDCSRPAAFLLSILSLACGGTGESEHRFTRFSMGTVVEYTILGLEESAARSAVNHAHDEMERVSRLLWENDSLSVLHAFNRAVDSIFVPEEATDFLFRIRHLAELTGGAFDPTVKPILELYDFEADEPRPPTDANLSRALVSVGAERFRVTEAGYLAKDVPSLALAVGAVAKGYAVDRAIDVLRNSGVKSAIVNAGGDLFCLGDRGGEAWRVGIRHPDDPSEIIAVIRISNKAVATSGDYQQYFEYGGVRYHHIVDPATGWPARITRSATVIARSAERADAFATALFVLGPEEGLQLIGGIDDAEGFLIDSSGTAVWTDGMRAYLTDVSVEASHSE